MYKIFEELLKEKGVSAYRVAQETGVSTATLTSWKKGIYTPKPEKLQKLADYFGVQLEYLTGASEFKTKKETLEHFDKKSNLDAIKNDMIDVQENTTRIRALGKVAAGVPTHMQDEYVIGYEDVSNDMIKDDTVFGLEINGDSMSPRILKGDVVIVTINGDEAMTFSNKEIEEKPVRIIGKVIENRSKF